jgi:hypothetical protein
MSNTGEKYFSCCEKCFDELCQISTSAARIWMDLCIVKIQTGDIPFILHALDFPELQCLEQLGYVVTTDFPNKLRVRVNGHHLTDDDEDFFCIKLDEHGEENEDMQSMR